MIFLFFFWKLTKLVDLKALNTLRQKCEVEYMKPEKMISFIKKLIMNRLSLLKFFRKFDEVRFLVSKNQQGLFFPKNNIFIINVVVVIIQFSFCFWPTFWCVFEEKANLEKKKKDYFISQTQKKKQNNLPWKKNASSTYLLENSTKKKLIKLITLFSDGSGTNPNI